MERMYIIVCPERSEGETLSYWKVNSLGYTTNKDVAGRYSKKEADRICNQSFVKDYAIEVDTPMKGCINCAYRKSNLWCEKINDSIDLALDPTCADWTSEEELRIARKSW